MTGSDEVVYLSTLSFPQDWLDGLRAVSPRVRVRQLTCGTPAEVPPELWREVNVLHTSTVFPDPAEAPNLRWVQLDTAGIDHIAELPIFRRSSVAITTLAGISARFTAEYVLLMLLAFSHHLPTMMAAQRSRSWPAPTDRWRQFRPTALFGSSVAIVGFGRIGRAAGELCAALGMEVVGIRRGADRKHPEPTDAPPPGVMGPSHPGVAPSSITEQPRDALLEVLAAADYVVVVLPLTAETRNLLDRAAIDSMKPGAVLVNVGRGGVVDEDAVTEALHDGRLAGAAFDVFATEPLPPDHRLWAAPNVIISPHVAGFAADYADQVKALVSENLRRLLAGEQLLNQIDRTAGY